ncbi:MAG TPA: pilus assembly protein TadG-related protein, partial [Novosphingobium sp.]
RDRSGNILIVTGLAIIPLVFAVGFGIDYSRAMRLQTKLNAAADAAALAAVTSAMMQVTDTTTISNVSKNMFNGQANGLPGLSYNPSTDLTVTVSTTGALNNGRTVVVSYAAKSLNSFAGILGYASLPVTGSSTAAATRAPYINFFLALDASPSMLLPSTSAGLTAIRTATTTSYLPNGCAFACHTQNPHSDNIYVRNSAGQDIWLDSSGNWYPVTKVQNGNVYTTNNVVVGPTSAGHYADAYWLTRNYGTLYGNSTQIPLRIDAEQSAAQDLIPFAITSAANNHVTYQMQMFTYSWTHSGNSSPVSAVNGSMTDVNNLANYTVPNFYASQDYWYSNGCPTSSTCSVNDMGSETKNMLSAMNGLMPNPGDGTTSTAPQEVLFIVTDGVSDELINGSRTNREWNSTDLAQCTTIKNRGIRIAILYTQYLPESLTGDSWSQSNVAPYLPNVAPALQQCASTTPAGSPLFYQVTTDQSITDALTALFALTVQTAHLTR